MKIRKAKFTRENGRDDDREDGVKTGQDPRRVAKPERPWQPLAEEHPGQVGGDRAQAAVSDRRRREPGNGVHREDDERDGGQHAEGGEFVEDGGEEFSAGVLQLPARDDNGVAVHERKTEVC